MKPVVVRVSALLHAPVEIVWETIVDWERSSEWQLEARDFVVVSPHREGEGVRAKATVRIGGITTRDTIEVIRWEPNRRLVIKHLGWVKGHAEILLNRVPDGTEAQWTETLFAPMGVIGGIGLRLFAPLMRKTFERDFQALDSIVSSRTVNS